VEEISGSLEVDGWPKLAATNTSDAVLIVNGVLARDDGSDWDGESGLKAMPNRVLKLSAMSFVLAAIEVERQACGSCVEHLFGCGPLRATFAGMPFAARLAHRRQLVSVGHPGRGG
jgi:hypothetical protein